MFPKRIYENGQMHPTHHHFHKRSVREKWDPSVKYILDINGESYNFNMEFKHNFVLPGLIVQKYSDNFTWIEEEDRQSGLSCYYHGTVNGSVQSRATLSLCDGMVSIESHGTVNGSMQFMTQQKPSLHTVSGPIGPSAKRHLNGV